MAEAGPTRLSKEALGEYWQALLSLTERGAREEILHFEHCTRKKNAESIKENKRLMGQYTDLPAHAPLASCLDVEGVWLHGGTDNLSPRSPYGSHRIVMNALDILRYIGTPITESTDGNDEDRQAMGSGEEEETSSKHRKRGKQKTKRPQAKRPEGRRMKQRLDQPGRPLLFFECAHHYGNTQYVRLLLVRPGDPWEQWCRETCLEVDIRNNPFLEFKAGRIFTYKPQWYTIIVDVLVVGDIWLDKLQEPTVWNKVGTLTRAGRDPILGVVRSH